LFSLVLNKITTIFSTAKLVLDQYKAYYDRL
jgi:hypothetical protein